MNTTPQPAAELEMYGRVADLSTLAADILLSFITQRIVDRGIVTASDMDRLINEALAATK